MGKQKRAVAHMKSMPFETLTPAQVIMRDEMAAGVHKPRREATAADLAEAQRRQPITAGQALDEVFGGWTPSTETELALQVIHNGPNLTLSSAQWIVVQKLVEEGVRQGHAWAESSR